jgi:hypothetical protein
MSDGCSGGGLGFASEVSGAVFEPVAVLEELPVRVIFPSLSSSSSGMGVCTCGK